MNLNNNLSKNQIMSHDSFVVLAEASFGEGNDTMFRQQDSDILCQDTPVKEISSIVVESLKKEIQREARMVKMLGSNLKECPPKDTAQMEMLSQRLKKIERDVHQKSKESLYHDTTISAKKFVDVTDIQPNHSKI
jgi:hypothetical protein